MNKTKLALSIFAGVVVIISAWLLAQGVKNFRQGSPQINVTGMAERQITSDLIVWNITLNARGDSRASAYSEYKGAAQRVQQYLLDKGIPAKEIAASSVDITHNIREVYNSSTGRYDSFDDGYTVSQTFSIRSNNVDEIEAIYLNIAELYDEGLDFNSGSLEYYYTKLNDLKMEMLKDASANAYERAQTIASGSHAGVGSMVSSSMGVFQILGLNSDEDYSWGGTFNTSSKIKVASITVRSTYRVN